MKFHPYRSGQAHDYLYMPYKNGDQPHLNTATGESENSQSRVTRINQNNLQKYMKMSPFEIKDLLIRKANGNPLYNAGRGNPNFFHTLTRLVFAKLQSVCVTYSPRLNSDVSFYPMDKSQDYRHIFIQASQSWPDRERNFFQEYITFLSDQAVALGINVNTLYHDIFISLLGCKYPSPPQIQLHLEIVARDFMFLHVLNVSVRFFN